MIAGLTDIAAVQSPRSDDLRRVREPPAECRADRRYLTGYSMGGYGVYRFATIHPDWWAGAAVWAGYSGEFTGNYVAKILTGTPAGKLPIVSPPTGVPSVNLTRAKKLGLTIPADVAKTAAVFQ